MRNEDCEERLMTIIDGLPGLPEDACIFARKPWSITSEAVAAPLGAEFQVPPNLTEAGLAYFLEVSVAKEVLEVLGDSPSIKEQQQLLIFYAENDAYPDWVYKR